MTQRDLTDRMGVEEILEWLAYDLSLSEDFQKKVARELDIEAQKQYTNEQVAQRFRKFFGV